ncbi:Uncharacterised protein [Actinomadura madurae]|nr:Uncharacterised protein [Actinomadura madurae]
MPTALSARLETSTVTVDDLCRHAYHNGWKPLPF